MGSVAAYCLYLGSCGFWASYSEDSTYYILGHVAVRLHDPLGVRGVDGEVDDTALFFTILVLLAGCVLLWLKLAWFSTDPGVVNTRLKDFDEVIIFAQAETILYCSHLFVCHNLSR